MVPVLVGVVALALGVALGFVIRKAVARSQAESAEGRAQKVILEAEREAERLTREALVEAKDEIGALRRETEEDVRTRREEIKRQEERLTQKERSVDRKVDEADRRAEELDDRDRKLVLVREQLEHSATQHRAALEKIARLTASEAKEVLRTQVVDEAKREAMATVREIEQRAREEGEERARKIVTIAIQRVASEQTSESTVSVFSLPSEDMKGRIIGREGRNIRAFEATTGVNLIIDDTPEAVVLSSFDPVRREIARLTLEKLVQDGRIHPARIEETYERSQKEIDEQIKRAGEEAVLDTGITDVHPEMIRLLGRLQFRTSYGQNVLKHLVESAHIAAAIAAELGIDPTIPKRGALLHDIGKAVTHEVEGAHAVISADMARKYRESPSVSHAIEAHHYDVEPQTVEAVLVIAADAISASRPGGRGEALEHYIKRLEGLEQIATSKRGVERCYAMQAGREIRVMVKPEEVDDSTAALLSHEIAREIEETLEYPGQIKITVIRESRASEYAK